MCNNEHDEHERQFPRDLEGSEYSCGSAEKSMEMKSVIELRKTYATDALTLVAKARHTGTFSLSVYPYN